MNLEFEKFSAAGWSFSPISLCRRNVQCRLRDKDSTSSKVADRLSSRDSNVKTDERGIARADGPLADGLAQHSYGSVKRRLSRFSAALQQELRNRSDRSPRILEADGELLRASFSWSS